MYTKNTNLLFCFNVFNEYFSMFKCNARKVFALWSSFSCNFNLGVFGKARKCPFISINLMELFKQLTIATF